MERSRLGRHRTVNRPAPTYSDRIPSMFGSSKIPAYGSLTAALRAKITQHPGGPYLPLRRNRCQGIHLETPDHHPVSRGAGLRRDVAVQFARPTSGSALTEIRTVPPDHPLYHQLNLQEWNGIAVQLNRFVADGKDVSAQIEQLLRIDPSARDSACCARACAGTPPRFRCTRGFEMGASTRTARPVRATCGVTLTDGCDKSGHTFAISKKSVELSAASGSVETVLNVNLPATETWTVSVLPG